MTKHSEYFLSKHKFDSSCTMVTGNHVVFPQWELKMARSIGRMKQAIIDTERKREFAINRLSSGKSEEYKGYLTSLSTEELLAMEKAQGVDKISLE